MGLDSSQGFSQPQGSDTKAALLGGAGYGANPSTFSGIGTNGPQTAADVAAAPPGGKNMQPLASPGTGAAGAQGNPVQGLDQKQKMAMLLTQLAQAGGKAASRQPIQGGY